MAVIRKGNTEIRETGRDRSVRGKQIVVTLKYQGLFDDLVANEPSPGDIWEESNLYACETVGTTKTKAGHGETTVNYVTDGSLQTVETERDIKIEIIWQRNDAPLIFQKCFVNDSTGCMNIDCLSLVEDYLQARTSAKRTTIKALIDAFGNTATKYLELRVRGVDSILRFLPIVRKSVATVVRDNAGADLGEVQNPDVGSVNYPQTAKTWNPLTQAEVAFNLKYIKMRDDITKTGRSKKWERIEEWHGFPEEDLKLNGRLA